MSAWRQSLCSDNLSQIFISLKAEMGMPWPLLCSALSCCGGRSSHRERKQQLHLSLSQFHSVALLVPEGAGPVAYYSTPSPTELYSDAPRVYQLPATSHSMLFCMLLGSMREREPALQMLFSKPPVPRYKGSHGNVSFHLMDRIHF